jgi:hypothetical protein
MCNELGVFRCPGQQSDAVEVTLTSGAAGFVCLTKRDEGLQINGTVLGSRSETELAMALVAMLATASRAASVSR